MNFIRPEVAAFLVKWREVLVGLGLVLFGLYVAVTSFGLTPWAGGLLMIVGAAVARTRRAACAFSVWPWWRRRCRGHRKADRIFWT